MPAITCGQGLLFVECGGAGQRRVAALLRHLFVWAAAAGATQEGRGLACLVAWLLHSMLGCVVNGYLCSAVAVGEVLVCASRGASIASQQLLQLIDLRQVSLLGWAGAAVYCTVE